MSSRSWRRSLALLLVVPLSTACGSTLLTGAQAPAGVGDAAPTGGGELGGPLVPGAPGAADGMDVPGVPNSTGTTSSGTTTGGSAGFAPGSGSTTGSGGTSAGSGGTVTTSTATAPGITAKEVFVGAPYFPDVSATNQALGGGDAADQRAMYKAVADDLNKRGGIRGRKLVPLYYEYSAASNEPFESQSQGACEYWTNDNKVFAIFFRGPTLLECAKKAGAIVTSAAGSTGPVYRANPHLVDPSAVRPERLGAATVRGLYAIGWGKPTDEWPTGKVGIVSWDDANYRYGVEKGYVPALKAVGVTPTEVRYITIPQTAGGIADSSAAVSNAVLSFADKDIDHVFIQDGAAGVFGGAGLTTLFLNNAESQLYYPRYGFNGDNAPDFQAYPASQQHGMLALDYLDYMPQHDEGLKPNPARERCFAIMAAAGVGLADQNAMGTAAGICDSIWFVERILSGTGPLTRDAALRTAGSLGTSFRSAFTYGTRLTDVRRDGAALFRPARFDDGCTCMQYLGAPYEPATD